MITAWLSRKQDTVHTSLDPLASKPHLEITQHIFANAPTMLTICLSVLGLIKLYTAIARVTTLIDNSIGVCVVAFLFATILSYLALRSSPGRQRTLLARGADVFFLSGLVGVTAAALFFVYSLEG